MLLCLSGLPIFQWFPMSGNGFSITKRHCRMDEWANIMAPSYNQFFQFLLSL